MKRTQSGTEIIPLCDEITYDGRTFTVEELTWTGYRAIHIAERPSGEDLLSVRVALPLDVADKIAVAVLRHFYEYPPLIEAPNAIEPREEIDEEGSITTLRLKDEFEIPKDVWAVIEGLREQANADECAAVANATASSAETPLPDEMQVTLTVDALRAIADRLERATRIPPSVTA